MDLQWIAIASFIISIISGPIVLTAVNAVHERKTSKLIESAIKDERATMEVAMVKERQAMVSAQETAAVKLIGDALDKERERSKELFALKHEVAEMKGHVQQLVAVTSSLDTKLDKMSDMLVDLRRTR